MPHVTILLVENEENGAEKSFSHSFFFSRLNGKVDKILSCFFVPFPFFLAFAHICITHSSQDYSMLAKEWISVLRSRKKCRFGKISR